MYWKSLFTASFFLSAKKTLVKYEEEILAFDFGDLVNGLGGALGLFLGWSLLHIFYQILLLTRKLFLYVHANEKNNVT